VATTSADTDLASTLRVVLARSARRLRQEADSPLTPTLTAALATIERHGPLTPSELADRERVQRPNATKLIARLEEQGLVEREPHLFDKRSCRIAASAAGRALLEESRSRKDVFLADRLQALSQNDRDALARAAAILEGLLA
jgi:DNA-binding MarR family transcriptional regulator